MSAKRSFFILLLIMLITGICGTAEATTSWLSSYSHRVRIPVNATAAGAQTDYQMQIVLHSKSGDNSAGDIYLNGNLQDTTNFNDIRFTASDGTTLKDFWIQKVEYETDGSKATVYVELDTPASGSTDYYLYYGKSGDTSASNYDNTFTKDYGESGLVGLWHMDEGTASSTADSSGNGYNGILSTGVTWSGSDGGQWDSSTSTIFATGSALSFDGANGYVSTGATTTILNSSDMTVSAWINPSSLSGTIIGRGQVYTGNYYGWRVYLSNGAFGLIRNLGTSVPIATGISGFLTSNVFQFVTVTFNYNTGVTTFYVNGTQVYSTTLTTGTIAYNASYDNGISIGTQDYKTGRVSYFKGQIDEVRIYNRILSGDEISRYYIRSKYASTAPTWATPETQQAYALAVITQSATFGLTSATLNGYLSGFGGDTSATVYFKWGLSQDDLNHTTASQVFTDYGSFSQPITDLSSDTIYYFQAFVQNSLTTTQGSILSFKTVALETDYYGVIVNTDGSLNFTNKNTGAAILSDSPKFYLNYGATTSIPKAVTNSSFEIDDNNDNIPDNWSVDKAYIRLSTEQASDGSKSLKFNATTPASDHRRAWSSLITIPQEAKYTISIDSYVSSFTPGCYAAVYVYYYGTADGTGTGNESSEHLTVPAIIGSWAHTSFDWTPPVSARSFKLLIYMDHSSIATVYFDNVSITEKSYVYTSNGNNIEHTLIVNGDTTTITATDDTNPYTIVNHQYQLNTHSPYINYTVTLQYKQDVFTNEERFDFIVPSQIAQVMTRDLQLTSFNASNTYWSDIYMPKVVRFANGLSFLGSDTMESMRLRTSGSNSQVSFYSDYGQNHPHFYFIKNGGGATTSVNETQRSANDTYSASVTFAIDTNESLQYLVKTRQPYGYDAVLTFTNHPDSETLARIKAVAYGTENESDPSYGTKGIAGRGIGWTKGVFVSGQTGADLQNASFKSLIDQMYQDGVVIVGHSITPYTDSRAVVAAGLATLSQYNSRGWIDHSASGGTDDWEDLASQGAIKGSAYYILDLLDQYNYQYAWSYIDLSTDNRALNMLKPSATSDIRPFLFYNNRVDDNVNDNKKIYLWSTINTNKTPDYFYTNDRVNTLISERGVHIAHEYYGYYTCENHAWYNNCGTIEIYPTFDSQLEYIAGKRAAGLLWSPPRVELGDYLVPLKDVLVTYNSDGTVTVTNNSLVDVTGITLLTENNIQSVTIDNYDLVSFGDSYGDKEMVLPTIVSGDSVKLDISYGDKDSSVPTIVSNGTGKNKVNEITGYWDDASKILTMTAEGRSGNYSFTVTIPSLANKAIIVKDVTTDTTIGEYDASDSGAITFTASLDSLHTFKIVKTDIIDNFDSYGSDGELQNVWHPNPSFVWLNTDPNFVCEGNSMKYEYEEYAEVEVNTEDLPYQIRSDWTVEGVKALVLYFYGDPCNSILPMYVKLIDGSDNEGVVTYGDNSEEPNDLCAAGWHEWNIDLEDFNSAGVDLTNIQYLYLGFGEGNGSGTVYFDDIQLYRPRCVLSKRSADFAKFDYAPAGDPAGDCVIDYRELEIMAGNWLMAPPDPNVDLYGDGVIDFRDFAVLAEMWLEEQLWP